MCTKLAFFTRSCLSKLCPSGTLFTDLGSKKDRGLLKMKYFMMYKVQNI